MGIELSLTGNADGVSTAGSKGLHHGRSLLGGVQDAGPSGFMAFLSQFSGSPLTGGDLADSGGDPLADQDAGAGNPAAADATDPSLALTTLDASALLTQMHMSMNNGAAAALPVQPPGARTSMASTVTGASSATPALTGTALSPLATPAATAAATELASEPLHNLTGAVAPGGVLPLASNASVLPLSETAAPGLSQGAPTPEANAGEVPLEPLTPFASLAPLAPLAPLASLVRSNASSASSSDVAGQIALTVRKDVAPTLASDAAPAQENPLLPAPELHGATGHQTVAMTALSDAAAVLPTDMKTAAKAPGQGGAVDGVQKQDILQDLMQPAAERPVPHSRLVVDLQGASDAVTFARGNASAVPAAAWAEGLRQLGDAVKTEREASSTGDAGLSAPVHKADATPVHGVNFQAAAAMAPTGTSEASSAATAYSPEQQIADQVSVWVSQNVQSAELKLDALGKDPVEVSISMSGNEAQVQFRSDTPETRDLLTRAAAQLDTALQREGLVLSGVSVGTSSQNKDKASEAGENARAIARSGQRTGGIEATEGVRMTAVPRKLQGTVDLFV